MEETTQRKTLYVHVPTNIVRNEEIFLNNEEFAMYTRLCFLHFRNPEDNGNILKLDHRTLMNFLKITDTRTFKKRINHLHSLDLIKNRIDKVPTKGKINIVFNDSIAEGRAFTKLSASIFTYFNNDQIDTYAFRQIFYYKSRINKNLDGNGHDYCFSGFESITKRFRISKTKVEEANRQLKKAKLLKIVKHKLEPTHEYLDDELQYDRYNNHYFVADILH
ncbi:hypothetical protein SB775_06835 [Peribacillus sp. SIMBA_075]|uniref:hypothetical protein n=1 Tax=Peribacillus sp. SIMBA_075 TaxID=3085813 RepID=UPI003978E3F1